MKIYLSTENLIMTNWKMWEKNGYFEIEKIPSSTTRAEREKKTNKNGMFYGNSILLKRWAWEKWFTGENNVGIQIWAIENADVPCHSKRSIVSWRYAFLDNRFTLLNCILIFPAWWMATAHNCTNVLTMPHTENPKSM